MYRPLLDAVLRWPKLTLVGAALIATATLIPISQLGGEFMPPLDEGDLLFMPTALPGLSAGKAADLLQQTDRLIRTLPEVQTVYGKAGRVESATDPAPLEMFETTIQFKPKSEWRAGMTADKLIEELDRIVQVPGLSNVWVPPIRNRIDMLATGIKSPVGVKVAGANLAEIDRDAAARYGMNIADVQSVVSLAVGGENIGETVEGLQRFPINLRYPRELRDSVEKLRQLPVLTERGAQIRLGDVADLRITDGPPMLKSENAHLSGWVYVDIRGRDLKTLRHQGADRHG